MTTYDYERVDRWIRAESNGWETTAVADRFEAGMRGEDYLEHLPFGSGLSDLPAGREIVAMLSRTGLESGTLLDFGCGNGVVGDLLEEADETRRWSYHGVDLNSSNIASCRKRWPNRRFDVVTDALPLPFDTGAFDVAIASGVIEFIEAPDKTLSELRRVTRGWVALFRVGVRRSGRYGVYRQVVRHAWGVEEHCFHTFDWATLQTMFDRCGLRVLQQELSVASGTWLPPDDEEPMSHHSILLEKL